MTYPKSPTARHLAEAIEFSYKTQRAIARDAGFTSANILSMMKSGESKVPINRIPKLSAALDICPEEFIETALREYHPELHAVLSDYYGIGLSQTERLMLDVLDEANRITSISLDQDLCDLLVQLLVYAGRSPATDDIEI